MLFALVLAACSSAPAAKATATPARTPTPTLFITTSAPTPSPTATPPPFRYVAIGASDTVGVGASDPRTGSWPARIAARLPAGADYVNLGVSGSLASQAATDQVPTAAGLRPQLVTVWLAVNDLNASVSPADYAAALRRIVGPLVTLTDAQGNPARAPAPISVAISSSNTSIVSSDLTATILYHLGIDPGQRYVDEFQHLRNRLSEGSPVKDLA